MTHKAPRLRFPGQLAVTAMIVVCLVGIAQLAGSREGAPAPDPVPARTRLPLEGLGRGAGAQDHVLAGRWRVEYDDPWFTGSLTYELRQGAEGLRGHLVEIADENGRTPGDDSLIFELRDWDGTKGAGIYSMEYEGTRYEAACDLELQSTGELHVRYRYSGYPFSEVWTRVEGGGP